jgi:hypothetical protein
MTCSVICNTLPGFASQLDFRDMHLDAVIGGQRCMGGVQVGRNYLQVVAIEGFPFESFAGMLTSLGEMPIAYRWSTRWIFGVMGALTHRKFQEVATAVVPFLAQVLNQDRQHQS